MSIANIAPKVLARFGTASKVSQPGETWNCNKDEHGWFPVDQLLSSLRPIHHQHS